MGLYPPPRANAAPKDNELVRSACEGDAEAFGQLVRRYQERVYMLALQMTRNHADADELSQQAFLRAFESLASFRAESSFFTWIYRITVNLCLTHLKNQSRMVPLPEADGAEEPGRPEIGVREEVGEAMEATDAQSLVWNALDQLGPELRAAAILVYLHDISPREAGRTLGCAEATVHWRLFKARKILKKLLEGSPNE